MVKRGFVLEIENESGNECRKTKPDEDSALKQAMKKNIMVAYYKLNNGLNKQR